MFFFFSGHLPNSADLLNKDDMVKIKRCLYALQRTGHPPVTTHNVVDDWNDPVLSSVRRCQMFNTVHDRVKIVFHPEFLSSTNPLFGLEYEEFVRGCHLGVSFNGLIKSKKHNLIINILCIEGISIVLRAMGLYTS